MANKFGSFTFGGGKTFGGGNTTGNNQKKDMGVGASRSPSVDFDDLTEEQQGVYKPLYKDWLKNNPDDYEGAMAHAEEGLFTWQNNQKYFNADGTLANGKLNITANGRSPSIDFDNITSKDDQAAYKDGYKYWLRMHPDDYDGACIAGEDEMRRRAQTVDQQLPTSMLDDLGKPADQQPLYLKDQAVLSDLLKQNGATDSQIGGAFPKQNTEAPQGLTDAQRRAWDAAELDRQEREQRDADDRATGAGRQVSMMIAEQALRELQAEGKLDSGAENDLKWLEQNNREGNIYGQDVLDTLWATIDGLRGKEAEGSGFTFGAAKGESLEERKRLDRLLSDESKQKALDSIREALAMEGIPEDQREEAQRDLDILMADDADLNEKADVIESWTGPTLLDLIGGAVSDAGKGIADTFALQGQMAVQNAEQKEEQANILGSVGGAVGNYAANLPERLNDAKTLLQNLWSGLSTGTVNTWRTIGQYFSGEMFYNLTGGLTPAPAWKTDELGITKYYKGLADAYSAEANAATVDMLSRNKTELVPVLESFGMDKDTADTVVDSAVKVGTESFSNLGRMGLDIALGIASGGASKATEMTNLAKAAAEGITAMNGGSNILRAFWNGCKAAMGNKGFVPLVASQYMDNVDEVAGEKGGVENMTPADYQYALGDAWLNTLIEFGGGDEASGVQGAFEKDRRSMGFWEKRWDNIKSGAQEMLEEITQGMEQKVLQNHADNMNGVAPRNPLFSVDDTEAVISLMGMLETGTTTFAQTSVTGFVYNRAGNVSNIFAKLRNNIPLSKQETKLAVDATEAVLRATEGNQPGREEEAFAAQESEEYQHDAFEDGATGQDRGNDRAAGQVDPRAQAAAQAKTGNRNEAAESYNAAPENTDVRAAEQELEDAKAAEVRAIVATGDPNVSEDERARRMREADAASRRRELAEAEYNRAQAAAAAAVKNQTDQVTLRDAAEDRANEALDEATKAEDRLNRAKQELKDAEAAAGQAGTAKEKKDAVKRAGIARKKVRKLQEQYNHAISEMEESDRQADEKKARDRAANIPADQVYGLMGGDSLNLTNGEAGGQNRQALGQAEDERALEDAERELREARDAENRAIGESGNPFVPAEEQERRHQALEDAKARRQQAEDKVRALKQNRAERPGIGGQQNGTDRYRYLADIGEGTAADAAIGNQTEQAGVFADALAQLGADPETVEAVRNGGEEQNAVETPAAEVAERAEGEEPGEQDEVEEPEGTQEGPENGIGYWNDGQGNFGRKLTPEELEESDRIFDEYGTAAKRLDFLAGVYDKQSDQVERLQQMLDELTEKNASKRRIEKAKADLDHARETLEQMDRDWFEELVKYREAGNRFKDFVGLPRIDWYGEYQDKTDEDLSGWKEEDDRVNAELEKTKAAEAEAKEAEQLEEGGKKGRRPEPRKTDQQEDTRGQQEQDNRQQLEEQEDSGTQKAAPAEEAEEDEQKEEGGKPGRQPEPYREDRQEDNRGQDRQEDSRQQQEQDSGQLKANAPVEAKEAERPEEGGKRARRPEPYRDEQIRQEPEQPQQDSRQPEEEKNGQLMPGKPVEAEKAEQTEEGGKKGRRPEPRKADLQQDTRGQQEQDNSQQLEEQDSGMQKPAPAAEAEGPEEMVEGGKKPRPAPEPNPAPAGTGTVTQAEVTAQGQQQTPQTREENPVKQTPEMINKNEEDEATGGEQETVIRGTETEVTAEEQEKEENAKRHNTELGFSQYDGKTWTPGVTMKTSTPELTQGQRSELTVYNSFAKENGFTLVVHDTLSKDDGNVVNGYYDRDEDSGRVIHIAMDAANPMRSVMGHELYHMLQAMNPAGAQRVAKSFEKWARKAGIDVNRLIDDKVEMYYGQGIYKNKNDQAKRANAYEEVVADSLLDVIGDERTARALAMEDRNLFSQVRDWVDKMLDRIHRMLEMYAEKSPEARILAKQEGALEEVRKVFNKALEETKPLQDGKKAAKSLGSNGRRLDEYHRTMDAAETREEMNAATLQLAGEILEDGGMEANWENTRTLLTAALEYASGGGVISKVISDYGLNKWAMSEEDHRAFVSIGRYVKQMLESQDEAGYAQLMGFDQGETGSEEAEVKYSVDDGLRNGYNKKESEAGKNDERRAQEIRRRAGEVARRATWALTGRAAVSIGRGDYSGIIKRGQKGYELFSAALKDSVIKSKKGEPIVWYHGSDASFTQFIRQKNANYDSTAGFYFTSSSEVAGYYAKNNESKKNIYPVGIYSKHNLEFKASEFNDNYKLQNKALKAIETANKYAGKGVDEKFLLALNKHLGRLIKDGDISSDVAGKIYDSFVTNGSIDTVTIKGATWDYPGQKNANDQIIVFNSKNIIPATSVFWSKMEEDERKNNGIKYSVSKAVDSADVRDRLDLEGDMARTSDAGWQLIDTMRQMKLRETQNEEGATERTAGYWKKAVPEIAKSLEEYTYGKDRKVIEKAVRELFADLDHYEGDARGFVDYALREAQAAMRDLYTDERENPTRDNLRAFFERNGALYITPEQKKELQYYAGGMTAFRRQAAGIVPITNKSSGIGLEEIWEELAPLIGKDPSIVSVGTMIMEFNDAIEKAQSVNGEERTLTDEEMAMLDRRALDLVAEYMEAGATVVPTTRTEKIDADKHQEALREVSRLQEETEKQQDEIDRLNKKLNEADNVNQSLNRQLFDRVKELDQLKKSNATREEIEQARAAYREAQGQASETVKAMKDLEKKLEAARARRDEYRKQLAQARKEEQKYEKAQHQIERLQANRENLKKQLEKMKQKAMDSRLNARLNKERNQAVSNIRKQGGALRTMLASPSEKKGYIPLDHVRAAADLVESLVNSDKGGAAMASKRLENALRDARESNDYVTSAMYDDELYRAMQDVTRLLEERGSIKNLSNSELNYVNGTLTAIVHQIRTSNETIGRQKNQALGEESADAIRVMRDNPKSMAGVGRVIRKLGIGQLNPQRFFDIWGHHGDNAITRMGEELSDGQRKKNMLTMRMTKTFENLTQGQNEKKFDQFTGKHATWYDTGIPILKETGEETGRTWKMNGAMRTFFAMSWQAEENREGMRAGMKAEDGSDLYQLTIPDEELMKKGKEKEAYARGERVYFTAKDAQAIVDELTDYEKSWMAAWKDMEKLSKTAINETSLQLNGFRKANVGNYVPIFRDPRYIGKEFEAVVTDSRLTSMGFLKERVNAHNPMMLMDLTNVINRQVRDVSDYYGFAIPTRNATRIYNGNMPGYATSVKEVINKTQGMEVGQYFEKLMADLQGGSRVESSFMDKVRGNVAGATLAGNPSVIIKQAASYPAAAAVLGWKPLMKAMKYFNPVGLKGIDVNEIDSHTSALWERRSRSLSDLEANANRNTPMSKALHWLTNGIQGMDIATTKVIWKAAEYYVDQHNPGLAKGSEEYKEAVARVYEQALEETQPEYGTMQRPGILRSTNQLVKSLTMYKTQSLQNLGILVDAATNLSDKAKAVKQADTEENRAALSAAKKQMATALSSQISSAVILGVMTALGKALMHKLRDYRDEKGDLTAESVGGQILKDSASSVAGMVAGGSELFDLIAGLIEGQSPFDIEAAGVSTINDLYQNLYAMGDALKVIGDSDKTDAQKMSEILPKVRKMGLSVAQLFGIPAGNFLNLIDGIAANAADLATGQAGRFSSASPLNVAGTALIGSAQGRETTNKAVAGYIAQAMADGNQAEAVRLYNEQLRQGKSADALNTAIATWQKENIPEIRDAAEAIEWGDLKSYNDLINAIVDKGVSMTNAVKYVEAVRKKLQGEEEESKQAAAAASLTYDEIVAGMTKNESDLVYTNGQMNSLLEYGDVEQAKAIRDEMLRSGKTSSSINSSLSSYWKPQLQEAYAAGDMATVRQITNMLVEMGMKRTTIQGWTTEKTSSGSTKKSGFGSGTFGSGSFGGSKKSGTKKSGFGSGSFGGGSFGSGKFGS